jgi:hypothetical protein
MADFRRIFTRDNIRAHPTASLFILLLIGLGLRLICIQSRSIWYDDAFSILLSERSLPQIIAGTAADTMPPLSYFILHFWMLLGGSIWYIRLLNTFLSLVVILITYSWVKDFAGVEAGLLASFLLAISPFQILHAQEVRMYVLLELGQIGSLACYFRIYKTGGKWLDWVGMILFGVIAIYSHNLAIFTLVVVDFFLLVKRNWSSLARVILAQAVMGLCFLPWLFMVPGQVQKIQTAFWTPRPGLVEIIQAVDTLIGSLPQPTWLMMVITVLCLQIVILVGIQVWKHRREDDIQFLMVMILLPGILLFVVSYLMRPVYVPRAMISSGVGIYILCAVLFVRTRNDEKKDLAPGLIVALIGLVSIISLPNQYTFSQFPRSPYQALTSLMEKTCPAGSGCLVLHDTKLSYFPAVVYDRKLEQRFMADPPGTFNDTLAKPSQQAMQQFASTDLVEAVNGYQRIEFVTYQKALDEYMAVGKAEHPSITQLKKKFRLVNTSSIGDLRVFEFEP